MLDKMQMTSVVFVCLVHYIIIYDMQNNKMNVKDNIQMTMWHVACNINRILGKHKNIYKMNFLYFHYYHH
jgi:hypothetical protein